MIMKYIYFEGSVIKKSVTSHTDEESANAFVHFMIIKFFICIVYIKV